MVLASKGVALCPVEGRYEEALTGFQYDREDFCFLIEGVLGQINIFEKVDGRLVGAKLL